MNARKFFLTLVSGMILGAALGCHDSSNASSAPATGPAPAIFILAPNEKAAFSLTARRTDSFQAGNSGVTHQAVAPACAPGSIGTFSGRQGTPFSSSVEYGVSCTGAYFGIDTSTGILTGLLDNQSVLYDQPGCQGKAYVSPNYSTFGVPSISQAAIDNSAVFRVDPHNLGAADASTYAYIPAGEKGDDTLVMASVYVYGSGCQALTVGPGTSFYALQPNDPQVSGESNAPVALPVVTGAGG